jgi:hypothetical protein
MSGAAPPRKPWASAATGNPPTIFDRQRRLLLAADAFSHLKRRRRHFGVSAALGLPPCHAEVTEQFRVQAINLGYIILSFEADVQAHDTLV